MAIIEVPIAEAQVGMYLVGIDVSWVKSPFYKHRFLLSSQEMIEQLQASGIKVISIDTERSCHSQPGRQAKAQVEAPRNRELPPSSLAKEMSVAKDLKAQSVKKLGLMLNGMMGGKAALDPKEMAGIVDQTQDSSLRNAHALLTLFHLPSRYDDLAAHCYGTMSIALMLGQRMDLSDEELALLGSACMLMDIGWTRLPPELLKNLIPYTEDEYHLIQQHADHSVELLEASATDPAIVDLVAKHHERVDGSGYFSNYSGDQVPLLAQIMSLADHYDSLIRGYYDSGPVIPATALKQVYQAAQKGSHNMGLVELLIQLVGIYPVSSAVMLDTGEKAVVTKVNWRDALRPQVRVIYSKQGMNLMKPMDLDLFQMNTSGVGRKIKQVLDPSDKRQDPLGLLKIEI
ncbi:MAG: DUF3391 domain-containing protein [Gammaproteobacteria bacterium]|nr:DUF3391 domain-containing protein [Gammaproteobacteria bacterium]